MDHALRTISYIADIGDLVVLMARRRFVPHDVEDPPKINRTPKMICHVFESEEVSEIPIFHSCLPYLIYFHKTDYLVGSVHCAVDWTSLSGSVYGIFEG